MTARLIDPIIPPRLCRPPARQYGAGSSATIRTLPLASAPGPDEATTDVIYGMGRLDSSGRIADRSIIRALGWGQGDRLTLTATSGSVIAHRDPAGMQALTSRPYLAIPAVFQRRCGLRAGHRVLLAASPAEDTLLVYPLAVLDRALHALCSPPTDGGTR